jgi:hypothetical protein
MKAYVSSILCDDSKAEKPSFSMAMLAIFLRHCKNPEEVEQEIGRKVVVDVLAHSKYQMVLDYVEISLIARAGVRNIDIGGKWPHFAGSGVLVTF